LESIEDHTAKLKGVKDVKDSQQNNIDELSLNCRKQRCFLLWKKKTILPWRTTRAAKTLKLMNVPEDR